MTIHLIQQCTKDYLVENAHSLVNAVKLADTTNEYLPDALTIERLANALDINDVKRKDIDAIYDITLKWYKDEYIDEDFNEFWTFVYNIHSLCEEILMWFDN